MLCFKVFTIFLIAMCFMPEQVFGHFWWLPKCYYKKCSNYGSTVYTTNGKECLTFPNSCYLQNANCERLRLNAPRLSPITLDACNKLICDTECKLDDIPVCIKKVDGSYGFFQNKCDLFKEFCTTSFVYTVVDNSFCATLG